MDKEWHKIFTFGVSLYAFLMTMFLWMALLISIPMGGIMFFNFNAIGEIWLEFWLMPIVGLLVIGYGLREFKKPIDD